MHHWCVDYVLWVRSYQYRHLMYLPSYFDVAADKWVVWCAEKRELNWSPTVGPLSAACWISCWSSSGNVPRGTVRYLRYGATPHWCISSAFYTYRYLPKAQQPFGGGKYRTGSIFFILQELRNHVFCEWWSLVDVVYLPNMCTQISHCNNSSWFDSAITVVFEGRQRSNGEQSIYN